MLYIHYLVFEIYKNTLKNQSLRNDFTAMENLLQSTHGHKAIATSTPLCIKIKNIYFIGPFINIV